MENTSFVVEWSAHSALAFFARAEASEVLSADWGLVSKQLNRDSAHVFAANGDVKEHLGVGGVGNFKHYLIIAK